MAISNFPLGFPRGVMLQGVPILQTNPGKVFWVSNNTTGLLAGQRGGSDQNRGDFNSPFATLNYAVSMCIANRGDIIFVKPGHTETISSSTAMAWSIAGVSIVGLGNGASRPTFTLDTANTATIGVSAANISVQNCVFVANFLSIAACFTLTTAKWFTVQNCLVKDTSNVLNFLNVVKSTGAANTVDGLTVTDNVWTGLGTTSVNSMILTANDIDSLTVQRNDVKLARTADAAVLTTVTAGVLTNLDVSDNKTYTAQTAATNGALINVGGTTSTGWVARNYAQNLVASTDQNKLFTQTVGLSAIDNKAATAVGVGASFSPSPYGFSPILTPTSTITASATLVTGSSPVTIFTVTGIVKIRVWAAIGTALASTGTTGTLAVGFTSATTSLIGTTTANGTALGTANSVWAGDTTAASRGSIASAGSLNYAISNGGNVIVTIATNSMTAGTITFYAEWFPVSAGANVVAAL